MRGATRRGDRAKFWKLPGCSGCQGRRNHKEQENVHIDALTTISSRPRRSLYQGKTGKKRWSSMWMCIDVQMQNNDMRRAMSLRLRYIARDDDTVCRGLNFCLV